MTRPATKTESLIGVVLCLISSNAALSEDLSDLYRITDGVSGSHVEYHPVKIPQSKEVLLAEIESPGKVTYFYMTDDSGGRFYRVLVLKVFWDDQKEPSSSPRKRADCIADGTAATRP